MADALWQRLFYGTAADPKASWNEAMSAAQRGIALDRRDARMHALRGMLQGYAPAGGSLWDDALASLRRANELNPNDSYVLICAGWGEAYGGNVQLSIEHLRRFRRLSPNDPWMFNLYTVMAGALLNMKDYDGAREAALAALREAPALPQPRLMFAVACVGLGRVDIAWAAVDEVRRTAPEYLSLRLDGKIANRDDEARKRYVTFLRIAAGLEDPAAAETLR